MNHGNHKYNPKCLQLTKSDSKLGKQFQNATLSTVSNPGTSVSHVELKPDLLDQIRKTHGLHGLQFVATAPPKPPKPPLTKREIQERENDRYLEAVKRIEQVKLEDESWKMGMKPNKKGYQQKGGVIPLPKISNRMEKQTLKEMVVNILKDYDIQKLGMTSQQISGHVRKMSNRKAGVEISRDVEKVIDILVLEKTVFKSIGIGGFRNLYSLNSKDQKLQSFLAVEGVGFTPCGKWPLGYYLPNSTSHFSRPMRGIPTESTEPGNVRENTIVKRTSFVRRVPMSVSGKTLNPNSKAPNFHKKSNTSVVKSKPSTVRPNSPASALSPNPENVKTHSTSPGPYPSAILKQLPAKVKPSHEKISRELKKEFLVDIDFVDENSESDTEIIECTTKSNPYSGIDLFTDEFDLSISKHPRLNYHKSALLMTEIPSSMITANHSDADIQTDLIDFDVQEFTIGKPERITVLSRNGFSPPDIHQSTHDMSTGSTIPNHRAFVDQSIGDE